MGPIAVGGTMPGYDGQRDTPRRRGINAPMMPGRRREDCARFVLSMRGFFVGLSLRSSPPGLGRSGWRFWSREWIGEVEGIRRADGRWGLVQERYDWKGGYRGRETYGGLIRDFWRLKDRHI